MAITQLIAHRIQRLAPTTPALLQLRDSEIARDGKIDECARELKLAFIKKLGKIHGRFSTDAAAFPLSAWLGQWLDEKLSFVSLTHKAMQQLKALLDQGEALLDCNVFFVRDVFEHSDELAIYLVDHRAGQYLDGELAIADSRYLDTANINLAAKINLREWRAGDAQLNYLSVLPWRGEKDLSAVFSGTLGFSDKADIKQQTEAFLDAVESYTAQLPEAEAAATRAQVVNYCLAQDKAGERVVLAELSAQVDHHNAHALHTHIAQAKPQLNAEFIPDRARVRQYIRISGRDELLSMSFDSKCLGESIVYDPDADALVIRKIPKALKSRLLRHLQTQ